MPLVEVVLPALEPAPQQQLAAPRQVGRLVLVALERREVLPLAPLQAQEVPALRARVEQVPVAPLVEQAQRRVLPAAQRRKPSGRRTGAKPCPRRMPSA